MSGSDSMERASEPLQRKINDALCHKDLGIDFRLKLVIPPCAFSLDKNKK